MFKKIIFIQNNMKVLIFSCCDKKNKNLKKHKQKIININFFLQKCIFTSASNHAQKINQISYVT